VRSVAVSGRPLRAAACHGRGSEDGLEEAAATVVVLRGWAWAGDAAPAQLGDEGLVRSSAVKSARKRNKAWLCLWARGRFRFALPRVVPVRRLCGVSVGHDGARRPPLVGSRYGLPGPVQDRVHLGPHEIPMTASMGPSRPAEAL